MKFSMENLGIKISVKDLVKNIIVELQIEITSADTKTNIPLDLHSK
jgi:hypothetical protein